MKKKKGRDVVSSKVEITKSPPTKPTKPVKEGRALSLRQYHQEVESMGKKIENFAMGLCVDNLLSVKMALMNAVRLVEERMRSNRE